MNVAYHGNYFTWFEVGRVKLLDDVGIPYRDIERSGFKLPVLEAHAEFSSPSGFDDRLTLKSTIPENPILRIRINYEVFREEEMIASGYTLHVFVNESGSPVRPPRLFSSRISHYFAR